MWLMILFDLYGVGVSDKVFVDGYDYGSVLQNDDDRHGFYYCSGILPPTISNFPVPYLQTM